MVNGAQAVAATTSPGAGTAAAQQQNAVVVQPGSTENQIVYQPDGSAQIQTGMCFNG